MQTLGNNRSLDVKPGDEGEKKGKPVGKGKAKAILQVDGKTNMNASDQKSDMRIPLKSKREVVPISIMSHAHAHPRPTYVLSSLP